MYKRLSCSYCGELFGSATVKKHEKTCYLNPSNIRYCQVCNHPIKNWKTSKGTCSYTCSNKFYRVGAGNGNYKAKDYVRICARFHNMVCTVCGESEVIDVHHLDHDHNNNDPKNLVPLCPTHHAYIHRGKGHLIEKFLPLG